MRCSTGNSYRRRANYKASGYREVSATREEVAEFRAKYGGNPTVYRVQCLICGKRIWFSGLGRGSHDRYHSRRSEAYRDGVAVRWTEEGWRAL